MRVNKFVKTFTSPHMLYKLEKKKQTNYYVIEHLCSDDFKLFMYTETFICCLPCATHIYIAIHTCVVIDFIGSFKKERK